MDQNTLLEETKARLEPQLAALLSELPHQARVHGERMRFVDWGCGRGQGVLWLLQHGYDAHGVDVIPELVDIAVTLLDQAGFDGKSRIHLFVPGKPTALSDKSCDIVFSEEVFEHVEQLEATVAEIARISTPGGLGVHTFPSRWIPIEPHMRIPLVHWWPKGQPQYRWLQLMRMLGIRGSGGTSKELALFGRYHTFYHGRRAVERAFQAEGLAPRAQRPAFRRLRTRPVIGTLLKIHIVEAIVGTVALELWSTTIRTIAGRTPPRNAVPSVESDVPAHHCRWCDSWLEGERTLLAALRSNTPAAGTHDG